VSPGKTAENNIDGGVGQGEKVIPIFISNGA
jgi:hypothetical protein